MQIPSIKINKINQNGSFLLSTYFLFVGLKFDWNCMLHWNIPTINNKINGSILRKASPWKTHKTNKTLLKIYTVFYMPQETIGMTDIYHFGVTSIVLFSWYYLNEYIVVRKLKCQFYYQRHLITFRIIQYTKS